MTATSSKGCFIGNSFQTGSGPLIRSQNPARNFETVFETQSGLNLVDDAVSAAHKAFLPWFALSQNERIDYLLKVKNAFVKNEKALAHAITQEMGKPLYESMTEAKSLSARIDLMIQHGLKRVATEKPKNLPAETRYHAQGVAAVIGPYNFPAHLVNAHVIPALLTGNAVVVKPSEVCPWVGELYAACFEEAGLPSGVFNMVQGQGDVGRALIVHPQTRAVLFTGSYATGRAISEMLLDFPHKILALEMGGKNIAIVNEDADLYQALVEILHGAFLTTGQRCTATSRVFLHQRIADQFIETLVRATKALRPKDPLDPSAPFGPLATKKARDHFLAATQNTGTQTLLSSQALEGGAFVTPSLHLNSTSLVSNAYLETELFGPDICLEVVHDLDDAIGRCNQSAYGLSNTLFSASQAAFERCYLETYSGVFNWNKSTNGALGQLPFGGVNKSGNQRAAGIDAVRYTTFPVAINFADYGATDPQEGFKKAVMPERDALQISLRQLVARHEIEAFLELYGIHPDAVKGLRMYVPKASFNFCTSNLCEQLSPYAEEDHEALVILVPQDDQCAHFVSRLKTTLGALFAAHCTHEFMGVAQHMNVPPNEELTRSHNMLKRLYQDNFVPEEKKAAVIDLQRSKGAYLTSIDQDPLTLFDAASQIASIGVGFNSGVFQRALDDGELTDSLLANPDLTAPHAESVYPAAHKAVESFSNLLLEQAGPGLRYVTYTTSGAQANEKAFDLCRVHSGQQGRRIIAFEGSFHGRTVMALHTTYNPQKRAPFEFKGYEASFVPFPEWKDPAAEPPIPANWVAVWSEGRVFDYGGTDPLLLSEIKSLSQVKDHLEKGDACAVIVEPLQCEGGDNFATRRFFNGLRALTRAFQVPLIVDEVQTGFGLLGRFFAFRDFELTNKDGQPDYPDCVTLAKKAQVGACLSVWPDTRPEPPHIAQIQRGLLQATAMLKASPKQLETWALQHLHQLEARFGQLVSHPRAKGYAFAFDLLTPHIANQVINQRFYRGYMVYIAGEQTMRFRLNIRSTQRDLEDLFAALTNSLQALLDYAAAMPDVPLKDALSHYRSPSWSPGANIGIPKPKTPLQPVIEELNASNFDRYAHAIETLEAKAYEPERRDKLETLRNFVLAKGGLGLLLLHEGALIGYALGGPLELTEVDGPKQDRMQGAHNTFYSADIVVDAAFRGQGLGHLLKKEQIQRVKALKDASEKPRYRFMSGRNRVGYTTEMTRINQLFGAYTMDTYSHQYGTNAAATYYRIPLSRPALPLVPAAKPTVLDWASSVQMPLGSQPESIADDLKSGMFNASVGTKLTLSNWVTPDLIRYAELLKRVMPKACQHAYFTSGRDEVADKGIRSLRKSRPQGQLVIGLRQQFFGTTTALARSLSEEEGSLAPFSWFDWPKVDHPAHVGSKRSLSQIQALIEAHGSDQILGILVELIGQHSGYTLDQEFLSGLAEIRAQSGIPLIFDETASSLFRSGASLFMSDSLPAQPNMVLWYAGSQLGHVFVDEAHYVKAPLTLISTWDGDEISMMRTRRHLLCALDASTKDRAQQFESRIRSVFSGRKHHGQGLWHSVSFDNPKKADDLIDLAYAKGLLLKKGFAGSVVVCPPINTSPSEIEAGLAVIKTCLNQLG